MFLLSQASPYESTEISQNNDIGSSVPQQRRTTGGGGKTIKKRPGTEVSRKKCVEALMQMTDVNSDDDDSDLADFQPPSKPQLTRMPNSLGQNQHPSKSEGQYHSQTTASEPSSYAMAHAPPPNLQNDVNNAISALQSNGGQSFQHQPTSQSSEPNKNISEQLNYIIHLLEEQQNAKTSTTTEELILYTFLGVFTIYIVDSFTKVGKSYTR